MGGGYIQVVIDCCELWYVGWCVVVVFCVKSGVVVGGLVCVDEMNVDVVFYWYFLVVEIEVQIVVDGMCVFGDVVDYVWIEFVIQCCVVFVCGWIIGWNCYLVLWIDFVLIGCLFLGVQVLVVVDVVNQVGVCFVVFDVVIGWEYYVGWIVVIEGCVVVQFCWCCCCVVWIV